MKKRHILLFTIYAVFVVYVAIVITVAFTLRIDPFPTVEIQKGPRFNLHRLE